MGRPTARTSRKFRVSWLVVRCFGLSAGGGGSGQRGQRRLSSKANWQFHTEEPLNVFRRIPIHPCAAFFRPEGRSAASCSFFSTFLHLGSSLFQDPSVMVGRWRFVPIACRCENLIVLYRKQTKYYWIKCRIKNSLKQW